MSQTIQNKLEEIAEIIGKDTTPQTFGSFMDWKFNGKIAYCATGGLARSLGSSRTRIFFTHVWPRLCYDYIANKLGISMSERKQHYQCPKCYHVRPLFRIIAHLNDAHLLTKAQIANVLPMIMKTDKPVTRHTFKETLVLLKNAFVQ